MCNHIIIIITNIIIESFGCRYDGSVCAVMSVDGNDANVKFGISK